MADWVNRIFGKEQSSAAQAKERLQLVLISDRTDLSPARIEILKDELITVISHHIEIDPQAIRIEIAHDGNKQRLLADIPLKSKRKIPKQVIA
ncbi:MAG: cell division topological specificity factor MinE [Chloroflexota bacterium]|jgi:cell division topological specificity factor